MFEQKFRFPVHGHEYQVSLVPRALEPIRGLKFEVVIHQNVRGHNAYLVGSKETSRAGLAADAVGQVVRRGLDRLQDRYK